MTACGACCCRPEGQEHSDADDGSAYPVLMNAALAAYNREEYDEAEALTRVAVRLWPRDRLANELQEDSRRMRRSGGELGRRELSRKYVGRTANPGPDVAMPDAE